MVDFPTCCRVAATKTDLMGCPRDKRAVQGSNFFRGMVWKRKSELNPRAAGKGVWHLPKAPSEELLLPPNALGQHVGAPAGWVEV